jgi:hypothetical protein
MALSQISCATHNEIKVDNVTITTQINVTDDWCYLDGKAVNGWAKMMPRFYLICLSLKSDMPSRTLTHEMNHIALHSLGLETHGIDKGKDRR